MSYTPLAGAGLSELHCFNAEKTAVQVLTLSPPIPLRLYTLALPCCGCTPCKDPVIEHQQRFHCMKLKQFHFSVTSTNSEELLQDFETKCTDQQDWAHAQRRKQSVTIIKYVVML